MPEARTRSIRHVLELTIAVFLIQAFVLFLRSWLQARLTDDGMAAVVAKDLSYLVVPPLLIVLLSPLARDAFRGIFARLRPGQLTIRTIVTAVALGIALRLAHWGGLISSVAFRLVANPDPDAIAGPVISFDCPPPRLVLLHLFAMGLLTPIVEEVVNRGGFLQWFLDYGRRVAIVVSAGLFAAAHAPATIPFAFLFGLFVGVLYVNTGSLWGPLITHATANALVVVDWLCLQTTWNPPVVTDALRATGILAIALMVCASSLAALLVSKRIIGPKPDDPPSAR